MSSTNTKYKKKKQGKESNEELILWVDCGKLSPWLNLKQIVRKLCLWFLIVKKVLQWNCFLKLHSISPSELFCEAMIEICDLFEP